MDSTLDQLDLRVFLSQALQQAGEIARAGFGRLSSTVKEGDPNQVLTEADLEISRFLIGRIRERYPDHNIVDEEAGAVGGGSEYTWVLDPIDGTSNFAAGAPTYGILAGLLRGDRPFAGGILLPESGALYYAGLGQGAFLNDRALRVSPETRLSACLVAYSLDAHPQDPAFTRAECGLIAALVNRIRSLRASNCVYDGVMVAQGAYGAEINRSCKIWDLVAQHILIEEAGGVFAAFDGSPIDYANPLSRLEQNYEICAAAPGIYQELRGVIDSAGSLDAGGSGRAPDVTSSK